MTEATSNRKGAHGPPRERAAKGISVAEIRSLLGEERYDVCRQAVEQAAADAEYGEVMRAAEGPREQCLSKAKWDQGAPDRAVGIACLLAILCVALLVVVWYLAGFLEAVATGVAVVAVGQCVPALFRSAPRPLAEAESGVEPLVRSTYESLGLLATVEACAACPDSHPFLAELIGEHGDREWALLALHLAMRKDDNGVRSFLVSDLGVAAILGVASRASGRLVHDAVVAHAPQLPKEFTLRVLSGLGERTSVPILLWGLGTRLRLPACMAVIRALGKVGTPAAVAALGQFATRYSPAKKPSSGVSGADGPKCWREAMRALEAIGTSEALELVEAAKWHRGGAEGFFDRLTAKVRGEGSGSEISRIRSILARSDFGCGECGRLYDVERTLSWLVSRGAEQAAGSGVDVPGVAGGGDAQGESEPLPFTCRECGSVLVRYSKDCFWGVEE